MITGVTAMSRARMLTLMRVPWPLTTKVAVISITDSPEIDEHGEDFSLGNWVDSAAGQHRLKQRHVDDAISLSFGDFGENEIKAKPELAAQVFSVEQARTVVAFLDRVHSKRDQVVVAVHCAAGVSRSAGVAEFIVDRFRLNWNDYVEKHSHTKPNHHVIRTLRAAALVTAAESGIC